jgi:type IV secretory pathway component VirB8
MLTTQTASPAAMRRVVYEVKITAPTKSRKAQKRSAVVNAMPSVYITARFTHRGIFTGQ